MEQITEQRRKYKTQTGLELRIMLPIVLWATITSVLFGVTWMLQSLSAERLMPIKASHIMHNKRAVVQEAAARLVIDSINIRNGSTWPPDPSIARYVSVRR